MNTKALITLEYDKIIKRNDKISLEKEKNAQI